MPCLRLLGVLSRACEDLQAEMDALLAGWPEVVVVVDRRRAEQARGAFLDPVRPPLAA